MNEIRYLISDASKKVDVETHVLRYWEEELGVSIPRNEMGHRYYTEFHIHLFCQVKKLKDRGYQLKAIKNALQQVMEQNQGFMQAAGVLEEDMARTLWENPHVKEHEDKEALPEKIARLADYNRLEPVKEGQASEEEQKKQRKSDEKVEEKGKIEEKVQNKPELKEKDGQTEMKKKGKNRKKPSAWERRNGMVGNGMENSMGEGDDNFQDLNFGNANIQNTANIQNDEAIQNIANIQNTANIQNNANVQNNTNVQNNANVLEEDSQEDIFAEISEEKVQKIYAQQPKTQEEYANKDEAEEDFPEQTELAKKQDAEIVLMDQDEKMHQFQEIMTYIIGHALEANNEKLSQEISRLVNARLSEELEDLMRIRDERDEERFRQFDEIIRSYQRDNQGKAEAAAARIPFFGKRRFRKHRPPQNA